MNTIKFSKNWNNKLNCDFFHTIRRSYPSKDKYYFEFNKSIDKKRHNVKYLIASNNLQNEFNKFVLAINTKYPDLKFPEFQLGPIPEKYKNLFPEQEKQDKPVEKPKPIMPTNFSICNVNGVDYIQFCKKIDEKKCQYKNGKSTYSS